MHCHLSELRPQFTPKLHIPDTSAMLAATPRAGNPAADGSGNRQPTRSHAILNYGTASSSNCSRDPA